MQETDGKLSTLSLQLQDSQSQVALLSQEVVTLQQSCEGLRREREVAVQALQDMTRKCQCLEIEKDKVLKEGASLHLALQKVRVVFVFLSFSIRG